MNASFNAEMLILAREVRGMTQTELAERSSIDQGRISRYEGGIKRIPLDEMQVLAKTLEFPMSFFARDGKRLAAETGDVFHRKRRSLSAVQQKQIDGLLNLYRMGVADLLNQIEFDPLYTIPQCNLAEFDSNVDDVAAAVRAKWRIPSGPINNMIAQLEEASCFVFAHDFGTDLIDEAVQWIEPTPPIILVNTRSPGDRLRFSLAHALGHLVLHHNQLPHPQIEEEADKFAAAFLMPAEDIRPELTTVTISHLLNLKPYWKVSMQALIVRAKDIGEISERQYNSLFQMLSKYGYRKNEPFSLPTEIPQSITDLLNEYRKLGYSNAELADLVKVNVHDFEAWFQSDPFPIRLVQKPKRSAI
ncbi:MAG: ImmA/IrrE family metallo-endopeptidase [Anaerolineae bacterium]|nr:ImmA/IrrE family metallo-endopeptidase [Anaerolineae bacterium]